jgi:PAS domain S-box-containing protein
MLADPAPGVPTALSGWDSADLLRLLIQVSPAATIVLDRDGQVVLWNPAAARLFGWAPGEILGRPYPIVPDEKRDEYRRLFAAFCRARR